MKDNLGASPSTETQEFYDDDFEELCGTCAGEGYVEGDCFEDTCCCADPATEHGTVVCPACKGDGNV